MLSRCFSQHGNVNRSFVSPRNLKLEAFYDSNGSIYICTSIWFRGKINPFPTKSWSYNDIYNRFIYLFIFDKYWKRRFLIFTFGRQCACTSDHWSFSRAAFSKRQARDAIWKLRQAASAHFIKRSFGKSGKLGRRTANTHGFRERSWIFCTLSISALLWSGLCVDSFFFFVLVAKIRFATKLISQTCPFFLHLFAFYTRTAHFPLRLFL